jgi:multiple sugar transport system substrate-binding protein
MNRRFVIPTRIFIFALILVSISVWTACEQKDAETAQAQAGEESLGKAFSLKSASEPYRGQTIRIIGEALPPLEALIQMKSVFEEETGIKVDVEALGYDTMAERATLDLTSRTGRYDIILQNPETWGKFAVQGLLHPINERFRNNPKLHNPALKPDEQLFEKAWKNLAWYNGTCYGYPFATLTMVLCYRADLMNDSIEKAKFKEKYGYELSTPQTWEQYRDIAKFFTRPNQGLYGTCLQAKRHPSLWQEWINFAYSFGGGVLERENAWDYGPIIINSPGSVEATEFYKSLVPFSPPGTLEYTWDDQLAAFQQGKAFMGIVWADILSAIEDPKDSKVAGKIGYVAPPAGKAGRVAQLSGMAYIIPTTSKHPEAAYLFVEWMLLPEHQITQTLAGGFSGYKAVYEDPRVKKLPYAKAVLETLDAGIAMRGTIPEEGAIGERIPIGLSEILHNEKTAQEGLDWIAIEMKKILGDKAELKYPPQK